MSHPVDPTIARWQADEHEIGMLVFSPSETALECFPYYQLPQEALFLGLMESDALCLMDDGSIRVYDHEVADRIFCLAAPNQSALIAALAVLKEHFEKCVANETYCEDESAAVNARERCTEISGGEEYAGFFCGLVGA